MITPAQISCGIALALAAASAVLFGPFGWFRVGHQQVPGLPVSEAFAVVSHEELSSEPLWPAPTSQSRDSGWTYGVFTPPEIFYDPVTGRVSVQAPGSREPEVAAAGTMLQLELLGVMRVPFRLQLVGYVGGDGSYFGTFENGDSAEIILAQSGWQWPDLGLELTDFTVRREKVPVPGGDPVEELVAVATVRDLENGKVTVLNQAERTYTDQLTAEVRRSAVPATRLGLEVGDTVQVGDTRWTLVELELEPGAAVFRRDVAGHVELERLTVTTTTESKSKSAEEPAP